MITPPPKLSPIPYTTLFRSQNNLPEDQVDSAEVLAAECAPTTDEADAKLNEVLHSIGLDVDAVLDDARAQKAKELRSEEHTSELQSHVNIVCRLLLEKKNRN